LFLYIDGNDARRFGSQGQQRSAALALKIAEIDILRTVTGNDPLLLLDDVMSELDEQRREQLLGVINHSTQTFITTTNLSYFDEKTVARAKLIRLPQINDEVESARG
jgi:DNA replication and repair protein RecF